MTLFICHGNVARSQFAEALSRKRGHTDVLSAGTHVRPEKDGALLNDEGPTALQAVDCFRSVTGIDIGSQRRKRVTANMAARADTIIVMTERENLPEFLQAFESRIEYWRIDDPHDFDHAGYERVIGEVEARLDALWGSNKTKKSFQGSHETRKGRGK